jgi:hypothetical protein
METSNKSKIQYSSISGIWFVKTEFSISLCALLPTRLNIEPQMPAADGGGGGALPSEFVVLGPIAFGVCGMVAWPLLLRACGLHAASVSPLAQGLALGSVAHVSGMVALQQVRWPRQGFCSLRFLRLFGDSLRSDREVEFLLMSLT